MSSGGEKCSRLCRLIDSSLRPFTEEDVVLETKEKEKELLIALSHVVTEVQRWIQEIHCSSDDEAVRKLVSQERSTVECDQFSEDHHCITKIISNSVLLLTFENQYVKHLVGNVLTEISRFVILSGSYWEELVHTLCFCMDLVLTRIISPSAPSIIGSETLDCLLILSNILQPKLKNASFSTVTGIIRALRSTLKFLKQEQSDLAGVLFDSVNSFLSTVPWNLLGRVLIRHDTEKPTGNDSLHDSDVHEWQESKILFLGNFVQFLCSLADLSDFEEAAGDSLNDHPLLNKIVNLIPCLLEWCLEDQVGHFDMCLSRYFRHKLLILMIRLSFQCHIPCSILVQWLQLCKNHFQKLLLLPMLKLESVPDDSLEDSPLIVRSFDEVHSACSLHLHRLAIFLFLRCSLSLICKQPTEKHDESATLKSQLVCTTYSDSKCHGCSCSEKGVFELYEWLQGNLQTNIFVDHDMFAKNCIKFESLFLHLYMHEDDLLFKVLLQLLPPPSCTRPWFCEGPCHDVKEDISFHDSNLFNPVKMFHLFLKGLDYDHEMLLDYLISKDAGTYCLEYLLRCLHIISEARHLFVIFSTGRDDKTHSSCKKRKVLLKSSSILEELSSNAPKKTEESLPSFKDVVDATECGHKCCKTGVKAFKKAKNCLESLKRSVENLHSKSLFPYNPEVLLKRLTIFLELCSMK